MDPHDPTADVHVSLPATPNLEAPAPLTAAEIRAKAGMREADVEVPGIGLVRMRTPSMADLISIGERCKHPDGTPDKGEATAQTIILCCPAFSQEDAGWLRDANGALVIKLVEAMEEFGIKPVSADKTATTFRPEAGPALRVDTEPGSGDSARGTDA